MPKTKAKTAIKAKAEVIPKPPVVVVLGHIDHGKSTLLHKIRQAKMPKEAGGITQKIGAYETSTKDGQKITFIDTPGHEAFEKARFYGAQVADVAVLVVAADQGVQAQTKEAIEHIKRAGLPMVVALNKVDLKNVNPAKVKTQLLEAGVQLEEQGGEVPAVEVSAKTGQNLEELLELIVLVAQMQELKARSQGPAQGVVIAAHRDPRQGPKATFLIQEGQLKAGDFVVVGDKYGKVRTLRNWQLERVVQAGPSQAVEAFGLPGVVKVGQAFQAVSSRDRAKELAESFRQEAIFPKELEPLGPAGVKKTLHLIIKADDPASLEAIVRELKGKLTSDKVGLQVVRAEVGPIGASDIEMALASNPAVVVGFNVRREPGVKHLARGAKVPVQLASTIYALVEGIKGVMETLLEPELEQQELGELKVLAIFRKERERMIVGGEIIKGELKPGAKIEVVREGEVVGQGKLEQLKQGKQEVKQAEAGQEAGLLYQGEPIIQKGDILRAFEEKTIKPKL